MTSTRSWLASSPYRPVLRQPVLRRLLPGFTLSFLGDGMSAVAIGWLAIELAGPGERGTLVSLAVAAYTLPAAIGAVVLAKWLRHRPGAQLAGWDAVLRAVALGAIPLCAALRVLTATDYVALLAVSSLLHSWGMAGKYTVLAEHLEQRHRLAGNALLSTVDQFAGLIGPAIAGLIVSAGSAATVIAIDAVTFAVLAISYRLLPRASSSSTAVSSSNTVASNTAARDETDADRGTGWQWIARDRGLLGLLALSLVFYLLYGPVEVALPVLVADDYGRASMLGLFWALFGLGAIIGGLLAGYLRRLPMWPTMIGIVLGWGLSLLPLGFPLPAAVDVTAFAIGGLIYAPWPSISIALMQRASPIRALPSVLAARGALLVGAAPVGTLLGGPLIGWLGARQALLISALATIALGIVATVALGWRRLRRT